MNMETQKILDVLEGLTDKYALEVLSEVVREFDLHVASNLIKAGTEPSYLSKGSLYEHYYGEGNQEAGHLPLVGLLKEVESVINLDEDGMDIEFSSNFVRPYTKEELEEENKDDSILWFKEDEENKTEGILIGFDNK